VDASINTVRSVKDIYPPYARNKDSNPRKLSVYNNNLYFIAQSENDIGLYQTDGTSAGTIQSLNEKIALYAHVGDSLFFAEGERVYIKDDAGVRLIKELTGSGGVVQLIPFKNIAFVITRDLSFYEVRSELWRTDGTEEGTYSISSLPHQHAFALTNDGIYFWNKSDGLMKTEGSSNETYLVKQFPEDGVSASGAFQMKYFKGELYFNTFSGLWKTDGTDQNTVLIKILYSVDNLTAGDDLLFFVADGDNYGIELWKTNGSTEGTVQVKDISLKNATNNYSADTKPSNIKPDGLILINELLYFSANDDVHGFEFWQSDGTEAGTKMLKDLLPGAKSLAPNNIQVFGNKIIFIGNGPMGNPKIWEMKEENFSVVQGDYTFPSDLVVMDTTLFFSAENDLGRELWAYYTSDVKLVTGASAEENGIYPNPTVGNLNIYGLKPHVPVRYQILNSTGEIVTSGDQIVEDEILTLELSKLVPGCYIVKVKCRAEVKIYRLVKT
jgi:ELWxxDGT repeat protein